eukprot:3981698-Pyramimonas_sp.AAC.1
MRARVRMPSPGARAPCDCARRRPRMRSARVTASKISVSRLIPGGAPWMGPLGPGAWGSSPNQPPSTSPGPWGS